MPMRPPRSFCISGPFLSNEAISIGCAGSRGSRKVMRPPVMAPLRGSRPMIAWLMTDLPEPDSPTRATVLPGGMRRLTPLTTSLLASSMRKLIDKS